MQNTTNGPSPPQPVSDVYEIFKNHFGEEYVDIQSDDDWHSILVWWPKVTITNEHNKSVNIFDLYARIKVDNEGRIPYECSGFELNKATYTDIQFVSGYVHSHVPGIYHNNGLEVYQQPCLGTGPIRSTIDDLKNSFEEPLWMLFCEELSRYVTVESLAGGPYRKLEEIGKKDILSGYGKFKKVSFQELYYFYDRDDVESKNQFCTILTNFTDYYLSQDKLPICFVNGEYSCGLSYFDFMISISNAFISWFNRYGSADAVDDLFNKEWLVKTFVHEGKFYKSKTVSTTDYNQYCGRHILWFKGQDIQLKIISTEESELRTTLILNHSIAMFILHSILRIINYHYGNEHKQLQGGRTESSPTYQTVYYL